jgi:hypothetical protein
MYDEDKLFVFDKSLGKVFIFNEKGEYLAAIDRRGNGPGEYLKLNAVCIDSYNKELILVPDSPLKLLYFDYSGQFIRENAINSLYREIVCSKDKIYTINFLSPSNRGNCYLSAMDKTSYDEKCLYEISDLPKTTFFTSGNYLTRGKYILLGNKFENNIYCIEHDSLKLKYIFDFGKYNLPEKYKQKNVAEEELKSILDSKNYIYNILNISENDRYLLFNTNLPCLFVYSKRDDLLKKYSFFFDSKYGFNYSLMLPIENSDNCVAFIISADFFCNFKKYVSARNEGINSDILTQFEDLDPEDNPIIIIGTFE